MAIPQSLILTLPNYTDLCFIVCSLLIKLQDTVRERWPISSHSPQTSNYRSLFVYRSHQIPTSRMITRITNDYNFLQVELLKALCSNWIWCQNISSPCYPIILITQRQKMTITKKIDLGFCVWKENNALYRKTNEWNHRHISHWFQNIIPYFIDVPRNMGNFNMFQGFVDM